MQHPTPTEDLATREHGGAVRVLIVEDDPAARSALHDLLEAEGYLVETKARGDTALERQRTAPADLLLTDLSLPDLDGLSVARMAHKETGCAVLIMTGDEQARHQDLGFEVLMKPIDLDLLLAGMQRALGTRAA